MYHKNFSIVGDCGNKYRPSLTQWHAHKTVVVCDQYKGRGQMMKGLKVRDGESIPAWGVIAEYTGTILKKVPKTNKSHYIFQASKTMFIDAEKERNSMRFINCICTCNQRHCGW
jgi:hypothetical protein